MFFEFVIRAVVLFHFGCMVIDSVGEVLGGRSSIPSIEFNTEVVISTSRVMTSCKEYSPNTVTNLLVDCTNIG